MSPKMKKLFQQVHKVPQIPEVVQLLISQFNDPNIEIKNISSNVEKEQVISLKVLRLVNSAAFGLPRKIASIDEAVILLGMAKLRTLVIASGIVSSASKIDNFNTQEFWLESFCTANYAKWLANEANCNADITFTVGLISNLGRVLIHLGLEKEASEIEKRIKEGHTRSFIEKMRLGFTSQDVSAELCKLWKFSDELIIPVAQCAEPLLAEPISKIACAVYVARYLSDCKNSNMSIDEILQNFPFEVTKQLELSDAFMQEKLAEILALESELDGLLG